MSGVESAASAWRKAGRCEGGGCVEVAPGSHRVGVRDSTQPEIHLTFDPASWRGLLQDLRTDQLHSDGPVG